MSADYNSWFHLSKSTKVCLSIKDVLIEHFIVDDNHEPHPADVGVKKGLQVFVDQHSNRITAGSVLSPSK